MNENRGDPGGSSGGKSWERSWTTEEMRQNAHAWTLAGDAGLLKHLQDFSQTVVARTHATEKALDSLVEEVNTLTAEANTTNNKFLCLANTQFVENRVYDDDDKEASQEEPTAEKKSKEETDAKMLQKVREALSMSVAVLDTMFEPVEIQASDSEGESESDKPGTKTLILEPHNPYINRPLPHLIGSEAFMMDDHIGLGDSPSDGEEQSLKEKEDYDSEASSQSDMDFTAFGSSKRNRDMYSSHSSVSDQLNQQDGLGKQSKKSKPVDGDETEEFMKNQVATSSRQETQNGDTFAAQLAAKLGKIASPPPDNVNEEKSPKPSKKTSDDLFGGVYSEDEDDALFSGGSGLFSGPPKLFDDLDNVNNSLWGPGTGERRKSLSAESEKTEQPVIGKPQLQKSKDHLFSNSISDDDNDLFSSKPSKTNSSQKKHESSVSSRISKSQLPKAGDIKPGIATSTPERSDPEEKKILQAADETKSGPSKDIDGSSVGASHTTEHKPIVNSSENKKPTGGVPMFGQANVLAGLKAKLPRRPSSSSESSTCDPADSLTSSQSANAPVNRPTPAARSKDEGGSSVSGSFQQSQSASMGFSSPALTSTRLSNDDGYQTKNVSNSISAIVAPSNPDNDSDNEDIFSKKSSLFSSQSTQQISGGLFADLNDEEDDLFAVSPAIKKGDKQSTDSLAKPAISSKEQSDESKTSSVSPSDNNGNSGPFKTFAKSNPEKSVPHMDFSRADMYSTVPPPLKAESKVKKPLSLFDDSDSGEDELLFSSASSAGSRRSQASSDILAASAVSTVEKKPLAKKGLFDDDDALFGSTRNDPGIDIFGGTSKATPTSNAVLRTPPPLPSDCLVEEDSPVNSDLSRIVPNTSVEHSENENFTIPAKPAKLPASKTVLQDEILVGNDDEDDDLFSSKPSSILYNSGALFPSSKTDDTEDDLFGGVRKQSHNKPQIVSAKPLEANKIEPPVPAAVPPKPTKPSLIVESEKVLKEDKTAPYTLKDEKPVETDKNNADPSPKLNAQQQTKKPEPPRTLNIRKVTDPGLGLIVDSDDEDLFGPSTSKNASKLEPPPKQTAKPIVATKPEPASSHKNLNKTDDSLSIKPESSEVDGNIASVSKLRNSLFGGNGQAALKIDPRALLPGQKPPPRRTPPKEDITTLPFSQPESVKPTAVILGIEQPAGFEKPASTSTTLPSANKDRVKLGVKRRPPSNKARREAARASMNFDQSDKESPLSPDVPSVVTDPVSAVTTSHNSSNSVLSPSTDEDDLFGVPQDLPPEYGNQNAPSADIFSGAPVLSPIAGVETTEHLKQDKKVADTATESSAESSQSSSKAKSLLSPPSLPEKPLDDLLFEPGSGLADAVINDRLFDLSAHPSSKSQSSGDDLFAPALKPSHIEITDEPSVTPKDKALEDPNSSCEPGLQAVQGSVSDVQTKVSETVDTSLHPAGYETEKECSTSVVSELPDNKELVTGVKDDGVMATLETTPSVTDALKVPRTASDIDPLNKVDQSTLNNEDELFGTVHPISAVEDHSSLFPFVKKKESKPSSEQPLFAQTPELPSKTTKPTPKTDLGLLDEAEGDDLFSASSKSLTAKKAKEKKTWNFSDEDDDDLFQSSSKSTPSNPSTKGNSSVASSVSSLGASGESKAITKSSKSPAIEQDVTKIRPARSAPKNGLFSDENDDDDLFSKLSPFSKLQAKEPSTTAASLFDDDDDDLFGSKPLNSAKSKEIKPKMSNKSALLPASSSVKKEDVFDDPLMVLQDD